MTARRERSLVVAIVVLAIASARDATADRVQVRVIEVAGGLAYIEPGADAGLRPGNVVALGGEQLAIVEVTARTAVVRIGTARIGVGDRGTTDAVAAGAAVAERRPSPRPPSTWTGQWPDAVLPATQQAPAEVQLGSGRPPGRLHARVVGTAMFTPSARKHDDGGDEDGGGLAVGGDGEAQARLVVSYDLLERGPLAADLDVTGRVFTRGYDRGARTPVWVRAAQLRYGPARDPLLAVGRLPWAATGVGVLDGARAAAHLGNLELAAFGGLVPDPLDGLPDPSATRFGAEAIYDDPAGSWQPRLTLTGYGSTWEGTLDERRAAATAAISRGGLDVDGWAELQQFPSGNPWGAHSLELTGAGVGVAYRRRGVHLGAEAALLRPERSLRLAAFLPPSALCTREPGTGDPGDCAGNELWAWGTATAGVSTARWSVDAGASVGTTHGPERFVDASVFGRLELRGLPRHGRVFGGGWFGRTTFVDVAGGELGVAGEVARELEVSLAYRPEVLAYQARTSIWTIHTGIVEARWSLGTELDVGAAAIGTTGPDRGVLTLLATVAWRPLP
jgi:hypothetical protein